MPRILFVKTSSLGDVVHNGPAVSDAARALPGAEIDWVVEEPFAEVAAMHAAVRRVIPVAVRRWRRGLWRASTWSEMRAFRDALRAGRYDAVIDTQSLLKSALIASLANGTRHGLDAASAREPLAARFYDVVHAVPRGLHAVERNRMLAAAALGYGLPAEISYGLRAADAPATAEACTVLLTMTSRADKLWPEARWIELGRALGMRCLLPWGGDEERRRAERIAHGVPHAEVQPRLTLGELGALFARSAQVIGVDTGLTHLAAALGAPTVGLYCGSDPTLTGLHGAKRAKNLGGPGRAPAVAEVLAASRELAR